MDSTLLICHNYLGVLSGRNWGFFLVGTNPTMMMRILLLCSCGLNCELADLIRVSWGRIRLRGNPDSILVLVRLNVDLHGLPSRVNWTTRDL